jgi:hypothetical protein
MTLFSCFSIFLEEIIKKYIHQYFISLDDGVNFVSVRKYFHCMEESDCVLHSYSYMLNIFFFPL